MNYLLKANVLGAGEELGLNDAAIGFEPEPEAGRISFAADETRAGMGQLFH